MNDAKKNSHNLQILTTTEKMVFIYVPKQFGHLSKHTHRAKVIEVITINEGNGKKRYKHLEIYNPKGTKRNIIWWHKKLTQNYSGSYWEFSFEKFDEAEWKDIRDKSTVEEFDEIRNGNSIGVLRDVRQSRRQRHLR